MPRAEGTAAIAPVIVARSLSPATQARRPEIAAFVRELVMRQDPEGYARNNEALAAAADPGPVDPCLPLLLIAGRDDELSPPSLSDQIAGSHGGADVQVIDEAGHWIPLEAARRTTELLTTFASGCAAKLPEYRGAGTAGLPTERRATTHWLAMDELAGLGVVPATGRVVTDGKWAAGRPPGRAASSA